jgi:hypothetical protein
VNAHEEPESINWQEFRTAFLYSSCSPGSDQAEKERVPRLEVGPYDGE